MFKFLSLKRSLAQRKEKNSQSLSEAIESTGIRDAADLARDERNWAKAARLYQEYLVGEPRDFDIWVQCAHAQKESGRFTDALDSYLVANALRSDDSDLWLNIGHLKKVAGDPPGALQAYIEALRIDPNNRDAKQEIDELSSSIAGSAAVNHIEQERLSESEKNRSVPASVISAGVLEFTGRHDHGMQVDIRENISSVEETPMSEAAWLGLGNVLLVKRRQVEADYCFRVASSLSGVDIQSVGREGI